MWFYIGILSTIAFSVWYLGRIPTPTDIVLSAKHTYVISREVFKVIRRNGLGVCLIWTKQVIANQIGNRLVEMHHKYYIIHYPYGVTWYKMIIPRRRGPCMIDSIKDSDGNDIKQDIVPYMGPSHNFHGTRVTPKMLGYDSITFIYLNGTEKTFQSTEPISDF